MPQALWTFDKLCGMLWESWQIAFISLSQLEFIMDHYSEAKVRLTDLLRPHHPQSATVPPSVYFNYLSFTKQLFWREY